MRKDQVRAVLSVILGLALGVSVAYGGQYGMQTVGGAAAGGPGRLGASTQGLLNYLGFQVIILGTAAYLAHRASGSTWLAAVVALLDLILVFVPLR